jgi:hypothetical protein
VGKQRVEYGAMAIGLDRNYRLFALASRAGNIDKPSICVLTYESTYFARGKNSVPRLPKGGLNFLSG